MSWIYHNTSLISNAAINGEKFMYFFSNGKSKILDLMQNDKILEK